LGVGYETIGALLQGEVMGRVILGILIVKSAIWALALGSGTSGGVLAPLLMMGAALGGVESMIFPFEGAGFWQLISMGAILGGTMRVPFTAVIFVLELTRDFNAFLPLFMAVVIAYAFTVLTMKRSILTEKISRRGFHLSREYAIDPLEILFVREVMRTNVIALPHNISAENIAKKTHVSHGHQHLYPVIGASDALEGVVTRKDLARVQLGTVAFRDVVKRKVVTAYADEPLRLVVYRMAETGLTRMPVVDRDNPSKLLGMVSLTDLLRARTRDHEEEHRRERVLRLRIPFASTQRSKGVTRAATD
jgi:CBS domain-containing protein